VTTKNSWLWQPPNEAIETLTGVLRSHWAAAKSQQAQLFWPKPANWLRQQATRLVASSYHLTSGGKLIKYASGSASVLNPNFVPRS
jgi:hypothetical protein